MTPVPPIVAQAMARRAATGLVLHFDVPGRPDVFTCYPKDEATKARWLANALKDGWHIHQKELAK
jgi:hypothetical protein